MRLPLYELRGNVVSQWEVVRCFNEDRFTRSLRYQIYKLKQKDKVKSSHKLQLLDIDKLPRGLELKPLSEMMIRKTKW